MSDKPKAYRIKIQDKNEEVYYYLVEELTIEKAIKKAGDIHYTLSGDVGEVIGVWSILD